MQKTLLCQSRFILKNAKRESYEILIMNQKRVLCFLDVKNTLFKILLKTEQKRTKLITLYADETFLHNFNCLGPPSPAK